MTLICIHGCRVYTGFAEKEDCSVLIKDSKIADVFSEKRFGQRRFPSDTEIIDVGGAYVSAEMLIDTHIHGTRGTACLGKDVLGSVRGVSNEWGQLEERYEYDAFGKPYRGDLTDGMSLGYTGKPYDTATGLYNYGYRDYQPEAARFTTVDPIRDGRNWFAYVNNDPVNYVDLWGLKPGDTFSTIEEAANDFGKEYNGQSIIEKTEYVTTIISSDNGYTYMEPTKETKDSITLPTPSGGPDQVVAGHHAHGNYDPEYNNNEFTLTDKETAQQYGKPFYVATPDGSLKVYDPITDETTPINTDMPSDPNDPERKNNINPATKPGTTKPEKGR
jgi:RHS repeat-associated protein